MVGRKARRAAGFDWLCRVSRRFWAVALVWRRIYKVHVSGLQPFIDTYPTPRLKTGAISQSRLLDLWRAEFFALPVLDTARKHW